MRVGFAGLGRMGGAMAANLVRSGHQVTLWNRSRDKAEDCAAETGAQIAATPRALAEGAEAVITMLADDAASDQVYRGEDGLFAASGGARWLVEMGTMSPGQMAALRDAAPDGVTVIDAPVSGATQAAQAAELMIMAGSERVPALAPLFDAMGRQTIWLGAPGAGSVMKLAINSLIHGLNQTLAEAMALSGAAGITPEVAFDAIEASAAAAPMLSYRRPLYLDEAAHPVTFTVDLAAKDMRVTTDLAETLGVAMPQARLNLDRLRAASENGYGARDMAAMLAFAKEENR